jgi:hypothetical protein
MTLTRVSVIRGVTRAVEKLFCCIPENYRQIARSIESLLDLSTMSIKEAIGHLKVVDDDESQSLSEPITIGGKLHLAREQWEVCQGDGKKGGSLPRWVAASVASHARRVEAPRPRREDVPRVAPMEAPTATLPATRSWHEMTPAATVASLAIVPRSVDSHDAARPTSHRWRRRSRLCSWHTQAPLWLYFTLMS